MALYPLVVSWLAGAVLLALDGRRRAVSLAAAGVMAAVALLDLLILYRLTVGGEPAFEVVTGGWPVEVGIRLRIDGLSAFFATLCAGVLTVVLAHEWVAGVRFRLFPALVLLLGAGLHGAFATGDLFNFYVFFEVAVVSSFALAGYGHGRAEIRGAFVYVVVNLFGSVLFLMGVAGVYHATGTLDLGAIGTVAESQPRIFLLPAALIFAALSLKLGLFPLHGWVPVLYRQARPTVVAAMTGALVNIGAYGLLRLGYSAFDNAREQSAAVLVTIGAVAVVYGALLAVFRRDAAELGAYVSIAHAGYVVLALGIGGATGVLAVLLVALSGSIDKSMAFLLLDASGTTRWLSALVAAASISGLPFTPGFIAKVQLIRAALDGPATVAVIAALLTGGLLMFAAVVRFWRLVRDVTDHRGARNAPIAVLAAGAVAIGILVEPAVRIASRVGSQLLGGAT